VVDGIGRHSGTDTPKPRSLEGQIVRLVDRVAYLNHDIDDAIRAGVITRAELPKREIRLLGDTGSERIDTLVRDIVEASADSETIRQGEKVGKAMENLRDFMFSEVYESEPARRQKERIEFAIGNLFDHYRQHPDEVSVEYGSRPKPSASQMAIDMVAGMTDRYCIATFERLFVPSTTSF
jgi:dGTPase